MLGERCESGTGGKQDQALAGPQIGQQQRAGRLAADQDLVAGLDMLQPGGERPVRHLDAEELELSS